MNIKNFDRSNTTYPTDDKTDRITNIKNALDQYKESLEIRKFNSEENKKAYEDKLCQKVNSGARLSPSEMEYLRTHNPQLYLKAVRIQMKREMVERKLNHCKSKQEVEDIKNFELGIIGEKDPDREALVNAVNSVTAEFKKTGKYKKLPQTSEEEKEQKKKHKDSKDDNKDPNDLQYALLTGQYQETYLKDTVKDIDIKL